MDAGEVSNLPPVPPQGSGVSTVPTMVAEPLDDAMLTSADAERHKAGAASLVIAGLVHVVIFLLLTWWLIANLKPEEVELVVEASGVSSTPAPEKQAFAKRVTQDKPSPPSRMATQAISAANLTSPVVMPDVPDVVDLPAFGSGDGDGFGAGGFGSGRGGARFFGTSGGGNRIILVIDTSTSMNGNCGADGIRALRREIDRTINTLAPETRFNIICFGMDADGFSSQLLPANATNKARAKKFMEDYFINKDFTRTRTSKFGNKGTDNKGIAYHPIPPDSVSSLRGTSGGSRMDLALVAAFKMKPSAVFLIADGEPGTKRGNNKLNNTQVVDLIESEAKSIFTSGVKPTVNCISVKGIGEGILKDIAKRFRGKYKSVDPGRI